MADGRRRNWAEMEIKRFGRNIRYKFVEKFGGPYLGWKQEPQIGMQGESEAAIRKELDPEYNLNTDLIKKLRELEGNWLRLERIIWKELVPLYRNLSFLTDPLMIQKEAKIFTQGSYFVGTDMEETLDPKSGDRIPYKKFELGTESLSYVDPDLGLFAENLSIIGHERVEEIETACDSVHNEWKRRASKLRDLHGLLEPVFGVIDEIKKGLREIRKREGEFEKDWVSLAAENVRKLEGIRIKLKELQPKNIRFKHTYKIIAPAIKNPFYNPNLKDPIRKNPTITLEEYMHAIGKKFRGPDEVQAGYDENGYPLEVQKVNNLEELKPVDEKAKGVWVVLLDKWWKEIADNEWQKMIITEEGEFEYPFGSGIMYQGKGAKGGKEIWQAKVESVLAGRVRPVPPEFVTDLDLLHTAVYIFDELDAVRDDLRDGRWHRYSKTWMDYFLAAQQLSSILYPEYSGTEILTEEQRKECGPLPFKPRAKVIPKKDTGIRFNPMDKKTYKDYTPHHFFKVPDDEALVTSEYQMKLNAGEYSYKLESGTRRPTDLNPAFDRKALNCQVLDFHWGRMYYYEGKKGINMWSENPFPKISSRGLPKYISHRLLMELYYDTAVKFGINKIGWDIGVRRPLIGGEFPKDLIGASDFISQKSPIGKVKEEAVR